MNIAGLMCVLVFFFAQKSYANRHTKRDIQCTQNTKSKMLECVNVLLPCVVAIISRFFLSSFALNGMHISVHSYGARCMRLWS